MPEKIKCSGCFWYKPGPDGEGTCHKYYPGTLQNYLEAGWPVVKQDDFCPEHWNGIRFDPFNPPPVGGSQ